MEKFTLSKDADNKTITIERWFDAPRALVWKAWTDKDMLEQWWAPKPWRAVTDSLEFREGGHWFYSMLGPEGEKSWNIEKYQTIDPEKSFTAEDAFCDEQGNIDTAMPMTHWKIEFSDEDNGTKVVTILTFETAEEMDKLIGMGFEEGYKMAQAQLDEILQASSVSQDKLS